MSAGEFIPGGSSDPSCTDRATWGQKSTRYDYIFKGISEEDGYPDDACKPFYHGNGQIDNLQVNTEVNGAGSIDVAGTGDFGGTVTAPTFVGNVTGNVTGNLTGTASGNKAFDIPHVKDEKKRIRHICAEGPEAGIYIRGSLKDANEIVLPEYWDGLIDPETITVTLTQIGYSQDLIVDKIEWGKIVRIRSGNGANINCYYEVWAARHINPMNHDEKLHVVYEGDSPKDYPGNNEYYLLGGWDYDRRETKWRRPEDEIDSVNLDTES